MSAQPDPPNWADIVAATAAVAGLLFTILLQIWSYIGASQRRLQVHARRLNESMCVLEVEYDADSTFANLQLEVSGIWPNRLLLLPETSVIKEKSDGGSTVDGDWLGRKSAVTCRMASKGSAFYAGAHVWRMKKVQAAWLLVTVRNRSTQKAIARRITRIEPMAE